MQNKSNKLSFSREIKKEIINNIKKNDEIVSFLNGLIFSNAIINDDHYILNLRNSYIANKVVLKLYKINILFQKDTSNTKIKILKKDFKINFSMNFKNNLTFFFAGIFVGGGSISDKNSTSYHLELKTNYQQHTKDIIDKLNEYEFEFHMLTRKEKYVAYTKKLDYLLDFLSAIGAKKSWFNLQNIKIGRDMENVTNRMNNIDISNLKKIVYSSNKHLENIKFIKQHKLIELFDSQQLISFEIKLENPWISLTDLAKQLQKEHNIIISKSGINHWFRKLEKVAQKYKDEF
ncbi:hypothetical protein BCF59_0285 [Mycoplasmopsis mustelae]|uniref:Probable cell division protein WhiA n=1 Tax=Mycoplasmopsis mustelae TaxID=171289 RepID=A0A4R7UFD1_9BACT|nr:DNA-binding protein WhiA [Mycoplasmopsis mustelae]TDV24325.1 hypothetical protein BCF59_0285 [Mycoplasmopsis mustelae]